MELKIINLVKTIGNKKILDNLSLFLKGGDCLYLKGQNGSGKTSFLRIIAGIDKDYKGEIAFDKDLTIGYVPQDIVLFEELSVKDNIKIFSRKNFQKMEAYSEELGVLPLFRKKAGKLSGGQKRLVNFLIGLANSPDLILLDEPEAGVDEASLLKMAQFINKIKDGKIIIITSHQQEFTEKVCNLSAELKEGRLAYEN